MYGSLKFLVLPLLCPSPASLRSGADTKASLQQKSPAGALHLPAQVPASPPYRFTTTRPGPTGTHSPRHCSCRDIEGATGRAGAGAPGKWERAQLSHTPATTPRLEGGVLLPDPRTHPWIAARPHSLISITEAPSPGSGLHRGV